VTINWTESAVAHLQAIHDHIALNSAYYALRMVDEITRRSEQIGAFPRSGRVVPEYASHEIREVFEKPYRIIYRVHQDQVDVLAVIHAARELPPTI